MVRGPTCEPLWAGAKERPMLSTCAAAVTCMSDTPAVAPPFFQRVPHPFRPLRLGEHPVMLM